MLSRLITRWPCSTNPLHHLPVIMWLFNDWPTFWTAYERAQAPAAVESNRPSTSPDVTTARDQRLAQLVLTKGLSVSAAARQLGISVQTAQSWAAARGIHLQKRPKNDVTRIAAIVTDLRRGTEQKTTARKHGVSNSTVSRLLMTVPGLRSSWESTRRSVAQKRARARWLRAMVKNPSATAKQLRGLEPASYAWLYRHDRAWLQNELHKLAQPKPRGNAGIDWTGRDEKLHDQIANLYEQLQRDGALFPVNVQQLYKSTPHIKPALSKLSRLPKTRELLSQIRKRSYRSTKC